MSTEIGGQSIFDESSLNITRRVRRCGHCRQPGHDIRSCTEDGARNARGQRRQLTQRNIERARRIETQDSRLGYKLFNNTSSYISIWWSGEGHPDFKFLTCITSMSSYGVKARPHHRFIAIAESNFISIHQQPNLRNINTMQNIVGDYLLRDFEDRRIHSGYHLLE